MNQFKKETEGLQEHTSHVVSFSDASCYEAKVSTSQNFSQTVAAWQQVDKQYIRICNVLKYLKDNKFFCFQYDDTKHKKTPSIKDINFAIHKILLRDDKYPAGRMQRCHDRKRLHVCTENTLYQLAVTMIRRTICCERRLRHYSTSNHTCNNMHPFRRLLHSILQ